MTTKAINHGDTENTEKSEVIEMRATKEFGVVVLRALRVSVVQ
jgi:hypothetical protein